MESRNQINTGTDARVKVDDDVDLRDIFSAFAKYIDERRKEIRARRKETPAHRKEIPAHTKEIPVHTKEIPAHIYSYYYDKGYDKKRLRTNKIKAQNGGHDHNYSAEYLKAVREVFGSVKEKGSSASTIKKSDAAAPADVDYDFTKVLEEAKGRLPKNYPFMKCAPLATPRELSKPLVVGGLPYSFSEEQTRELLEVFGALRAIFLLKDRETGNCKGYAYCAYQDASVSDFASEYLNGMRVGEKTLSIRLANGRPVSDRHSVLDFACENLNGLRLC